MELLIFNSLAPLHPGLTLDLLILELLSFIYEAIALRRPFMSYIDRGSGFPVPFTVLVLTEGYISDQVREITWLIAQCFLLLAMLLFILSKDAIDFEWPYLNKSTSPIAIQLLWPSLRTASSSSSPNLCTHTWTDILCVHGPSFPSGFRCCSTLLKATSSVVHFATLALINAHVLWNIWTIHGHSILRYLHHLFNHIVTEPSNRTGIRELFFWLNFSSCNRHFSTASMRNARLQAPVLVFPSWDQYSYISWPVGVSSCSFVHYPNVGWPNYCRIQDSTICTCASSRNL